MGASKERQKQKNELRDMTLPDMKKMNRRDSEKARNKIQVGMVIDKLNKCVEGKVELTQQQVKAAEILLNKTMANLSHNEINIQSEVKVTPTADTLNRIREFQQAKTLETRTLERVEEIADIKTIQPLEDKEAQDLRISQNTKLNKDVVQSIIE